MKPKPTDVGEPFTRETPVAPAALFVAGILSLHPDVAHAESLPVSINPTQLEFTANPGERLTGTFSVWNGTESGLPIHLEAADLQQQDEEGHAAVGAEDPVNSLKSWVKPEIPDLTVFPKQKISLGFSIDIPLNADPGSHWGALLVITVSPAIGGSGAATQVRTGVILLVRVLGDAKEKLTLESAALARFAEAPPIILETRFRNEGTVHEAPVGNIEVRNVFGSLVATGTLPVRNVLPGVARKIEASVGEGFWFGRYTVNLSATYGDNGEKLSVSRTVWVVPWRTLWPWALLARFL